MNSKTQQKTIISIVVILLIAVFVYGYFNAGKTAAPVTTAPEITIDMGTDTKAIMLKGKMETNDQPSKMTMEPSKTITTKEGLQITDTVIGTGNPVKVGDNVLVQYTGTLTDGTKFDSSYDRNATPIQVTVGAGQVIQGWDIGLQGMKLGGKRHIVIPANLAYGSQSPSPAIPANSTLVFDMEIVAIKN